MVEENSTEETKAARVGQDSDETDPLIPADHAAENRATTSIDESKQTSPGGFYKIMFSRGSTYAALLNVAAFSMIISGFDTTLPIHLKDEFGWKPAPIGSIFLGIQIPSMVCTPNGQFYRESNLILTDIVFRFSPLSSAGFEIELDCFGQRR